MEAGKHHIIVRRSVDGRHPLSRRNKTKVYGRRLVNARPYFVGLAERVRRYIASDGRTNDTSDRVGFPKG